jgi:hypothetical protein
MQNNFPQISTMNVEEIQLSRQVSLPCFITSQIPGAEGCRWRIFEIEDNSNDSLVVKSLLSSCLVRFELLFLNTDPCF